MTGDAHALWDAVGPLARRDSRPADMGEDFDFGDDQEMRTRLPRLFAQCRGDSPS